MLTLLFILFIFFLGMWVQKRFAPKFTLKNSHLTMDYRGPAGERLTKRVF